MSGYRSNKRPPHIVFLVDTLPFLSSNTLDETSVTSLQSMIVRILLYYVDMVDDRITWGFRFFNTNSASITMSNRRFLPVSSHSIHEFVKELHTKIDHERAKLATETTRLTEQHNKKTTKNDTDSCFSNLKQTLMQILAEFQWKDIDLLGASPRSQRIRNSAKTGLHHHDQLIPIKNYMYVISHRPHTMVDLQHYMYSCQDKKSVQTKLTSKGDMVDALTCIQRMADELKRWLWDNYANHQISINWIDRENTKAHKEMDLLIRTGFGSIMQMFGGHLITETMLRYDYNYWGLSFGTVFDHYRSLHMDSTPELKLPMVPDQQGKKLISMNECNNKTDTPIIWCGPLITKFSTQSLLQVNAGSLKRFKPTIENTHRRDNASTNLAHTTLFDEIESIEVVEFVYVDEIKVEWLQYTGEDAHTLWSSNHEFSAIIAFLQERQMVLIVRLCPSSNDNAKLGLVEPVFDGCAFILPLPGSESTFTPTCDSIHDNVQTLGSNITDSLELRSLPSLSHELDTTRMEADMNSSMTPPPCVNALLERFSRSSIKNMAPPLDKAPKITKLKETSARSMPRTIDQFTQVIQDLYLDTLYTTKYTLLESMTILLSYINHVSSLANQNEFEISLVIASLQSIIMLSSEFDDKHRVKIPAMMKVGMNEGSEQEILFFSNWLADIRAKCDRNTDHEELSFKALKIKDAKLQVIFLLATIQTIKEGKGSKEQEKAMTANKKKRRDRRDVGQTNLASEIPEEQLEIYFDRMFIWEQVSNVVGFLQERDAEAAEHSTKRLDPADIHIHVFCSHLEKCFVKLPRLIAKLWEKVDKDDDKDDFDDVFPTPNKRRKTLLEMRMRGDSPGETTTAHWITPPNADSQESIFSSSSSKSRHQQRVEPTPSGASKRKQSMFPILPFMKREIIMSKVVNSKAKQPTVETPENKPSFRRTGSFTKSATSPNRRIVRRKATTETNTVVLRKRAPNSPTTPRTRLAREFGISMTPGLTSASSTSVNTDDSSNDLQPSNVSMTSLSTRSPHRPRSTREFGIAVSPARSAARKIIGYKSPRSHRTGSARDLIHSLDEGEASDGPRDLTNALLAARNPTMNEYRAKSDVRRAFSSLFDD